MTNNKCQLNFKLQILNFKTFVIYHLLFICGFEFCHLKLKIIDLVYY